MQISAFLRLLQNFNTKDVVDAIDYGEGTENVYVLCNSGEPQSTTFFNIDGKPEKGLVEAGPIKWL